MSWESFCKGLKEKAPAILTGVGVGAFITGTVTAVIATPKALEDIEEFKLLEGHEKLTFWQTIQACWKRYIWTAISMGIGTGCVIASLVKCNQRIASLAAGLDVAQNGLREFCEYRKVMQQEIGEQKEKEVYQKTVERQIQQNPPPVQMTENFIEGTQPLPICYDATFGRYFYATYEMVASAVLKISTKVTGSLDQCASVNDLYFELGVAPIEHVGDILGWSIETGVPTIPPKESIQYAGTPNGTPCWVLTYDNPPQYEFQFFRR